MLIQTINLITCTKFSFQPATVESFSKELSKSELCQTARLFSVKVLGENFWGSGILIQKQGMQYTLVTNGHVLAKAEKYKIETHDAKQHEASVLVRFDHGNWTGEDLAILQFNSNSNYQVATLAKWAQGEKVMAAGFPIDAAPSLPHGFMCTPMARVSRRLNQPMQKGYQLGYFLNILNGMSGGALLNNQGKVVGINGMGIVPIFVNSNSYLYKNGTKVSDSLGLPSEKATELLSSSSWAIPSEKLVYLSPNALNLKISPSIYTNQ